MPDLSLRGHAGPVKPILIKGLLFLPLRIGFPPVDPPFAGSDLADEGVSPIFWRFR